MEVIQNIKNVLKNVKLIKDKNLYKQYQKVQKVDDFTDNIKDLINPSLDLIEQKAVPRLTYFNNIQQQQQQQQQQQPKAIQSSSDLHGSSSNPSNNGETILNEPAAFSIVQEAPDEEEIEPSPIDFDKDIESSPNRLAVVIDDHLDREILKNHSLPSFDFLRKRYDSLFTENQSKARDFKVICDDLTMKMKSISGKMGVIKKRKVLSEDSKKEEIIRLKFEISQIKKYKEKLIFMKPHFDIEDSDIRSSGIFFYKDIKDLKDRLLLVWVEIESGNENPPVINEFVEIMDEMLKQGEIGLKTLNKVYNELHII